MHEFESGFFVKHGAWHRLGNVLQNAPDSETAIKQAGLDWTVSKRPLLVTMPEGDVPVADYFGIVRNTDSRTLGVVGHGYMPLQPRKAFAPFDPLVQSGELEYEAAGSLQEGRKIWILARPRAIPVGTVGATDAVIAYLLLTNSYDGSSAVVAKWTATRVVCMNTLRAALSEKGDEIKIRHTASVEESVERLGEFIDTGSKSFSLTIEQYRKMRDQFLDIEGLERFVRKVFDREPTEIDPTPKLPKAWDNVLNNFHHGKGSTLSGNSVWGGLNAVTEFIDHQRGRSAESRFDASIFGAGAVLRNKATDVALSLVQ